MNQHLIVIASTLFLALAISLWTRNDARSSSPKLSRGPFVTAWTCCGFMTVVVTLLILAEAGFTLMALYPMFVVLTILGSSTFTWYYYRGRMRSPSYRMKVRTKRRYRRTKRQPPRPRVSATRASRHVPRVRR